MQIILTKKNNNNNLVFAWGGREWQRDMGKSDQTKNFGSGRYVQYPDCNDGFMGMNICQNISILILICLY